MVGDTVGGIPNQFIRWPSTAAERQEIKQGFFLKREAFPESLAASMGRVYIFLASLGIPLAIEAQFNRHLREEQEPFVLECMNHLLFY